MKNLKTFLNEKMQLRAIYQPIIIATLLRSEDGKASLKQIGQNVSYALFGTATMTEHFIAKMKRHPNKVLTKHGIATVVPKSGEFSFLADVAKLTPSQKQELIQLCDHKILEYLKENGHGPYQKDDTHAVQSGAHQTNFAFR